MQNHSRISSYNALFVGDPGFISVDEINLLTPTIPSLVFPNLNRAIFTHKFFGLRGFFDSIPAKDFTIFGKMQYQETHVYPHSRNNPRYYDFVFDDFSIGIIYLLNNNQSPSLIRDATVKNIRVETLTVQNMARVVQVWYQGENREDSIYLRPAL